MSNCSQLFSIYDLDSSTIENEFFHTDTCINNKFKISIYIIYLFLWVILFLWTLFVLINNCIVTHFKWSIVKLLYILIAFVSLSGVITYCLFLAGIQHFARFLVLPISAIFIRYACAILVRTWFNASLGLTGRTNHKLKKQFEISSNILNYTVYVIYAVCFVIGPMISASQNNYILLNWFYILGVSLPGVDNGLMCVIVYFVTRKLVELCKTEDGITSDEVTEFAEKMLFVNRVSIVYACFEGLYVLLPLWMLRQPYGLSGVFYFHFFVFEMIIYSASFTVFWSITKKGKMLGLITTKHNDHSKISDPKIVLTDTTTDGIIKDIGSKDIEIHEKI